jgi:osmotically-inducible protein OsmY
MRMFKTTSVPMVSPACIEFLVVLLACVLVAGTCFAADQPVSDGAIYDKVRLKLAHDAEMKVGDLQVDVRQGVVTLSGTAQSSRMKGKAGRLAKKVKGVKQVINNIEIPKHE